MNTELLEAPKMDVVKLNITDAAISQMREDFMPLRIDGVNDKAGLRKVYESRQIVKKTRVGVVKYADELKEQAIIWQNKVNTEKNRVVDKLKEIEEHLQKEEDRIAEEKERIQKEIEEKENARIQDRIDQLAVYGFGIDYTTIKSIDNETFQTILNNAKIEFAKEQEAKAEAERLAKEEAARLRAEREELEKLRSEAAKAQAIIDSENERIRNENLAKERAIREEREKIEAEKKAIELQKQKDAEEKIRAEQIEKAKAEATERARLEAIAEAMRAEEDKIAAERLAKIEEERQAALRPDKEKLQAFANTLSTLAIPTVSNEPAQLIVNDIQVMIDKMKAHILKKIKDL